MGSDGDAGGNGGRSQRKGSGDLGKHFECEDIKSCVEWVSIGFWERCSWFEEDVVKKNWRWSRRSDKKRLLVKE